MLKTSVEYLTRLKTLLWLLILGTACGIAKADTFDIDVLRSEVPSGNYLSRLMSELGTDRMRMRMALEPVPKDSARVVAKDPDGTILSGPTWVLPPDAVEQLGLYGERSEWSASDGEFSPRGNVEYWERRPNSTRELFPSGSFLEKGIRQMMDNPATDLGAVKHASGPLGRFIYIRFVLMSALHCIGFRTVSDDRWMEGFYCARLNQATDDIYWQTLLGSIDVGSERP